MDVQMPDGTIITGVPDDITQSELLRRYKKSAEASPKDSPYNIFPTDRNPYDEGLSDKQKQVFGLTARAAPDLLPFMSIAKMPGDLLAAAGNQFDIPYLKDMGSTAAIDRAMTWAGVPEPQTKYEQQGLDIARTLASVRGMNRTGAAMKTSPNETVRGVGGVLESNPAAQTSAALGGGVAAEYGKEQNYGPWAQLGIGALGSTAGSAPFLAKDAARYAARGGEAGRQQMETRLHQFKEAGVDPTLGQATGNMRTQMLDAVLAKMPGSVAAYARKALEQADQFGVTIRDISKNIAPRSDNARAGNAVNFGKFKDLFQTTQERLYNKVDMFIPGKRPIDVSNTLKALQMLNAEIPGAEAVSRILKNPKLAKVEEALRVDTGGTPPTQSSVLSASGTPFTTPGTPATNALPYQALKDLRSAVGREIGNSSLAPDVPAAMWKQVYAAMSEDMKAAAANAGPRALKHFERANAYTKAGHDRISDYLESIQSIAGPSERYNALAGRADRSPSQFNAAMRSLTPEAQDMVRAAKIKEMGLATAGNQDADMSRYSPDRFLTQWNNVDPLSKPVLLGPNPETANRVRNAAQVASMMKDARRMGQNPSGTTQGAAGVGAVGGAGYGALTGNLEIPAAIGGLALTANRAAAKTMDPAFQRWLALKGDPNPLGAIYTRNLLDLIQ